MVPRIHSAAELIRLRGIAAADRRVLFCIPCQLGMVAVAMKLLPVDPRNLEVPYVFVVLFSLCFTVQLGMRLQGLAAAFFLGLLSANGPFGAIVLLLIHLWAIVVLRGAGFPAGLLGISPRRIQLKIEAVETPAAT